MDTRAPDAYELEMSVDETETATTLHEHYYVAGELKDPGRTLARARRYCRSFAA